MDSILQAGLQGVQNGLDQFGRAANNVATSVSQTISTTDSTSPTANAVEVKQAQQTVEASAKVVSAADEAVGTLLDELA